MRRRDVLQTAVGSSIAMTAGCLGGSDNDNESSVTIGALQPFSGPFAAWGQAHQLGLEIAIEEANEDESIDQEFDTVSADTESEATEASTLFTRFVEEDGAVAITGAVSSDVGIRTADTAEDMGIPNFLHMSGTHAVLTPESRFTFRVGWLPAPTHVRADLEFIQERGFETVGAIIADYAWGRAVETSIEEFFPEDITVHLEVAPQNQDDFTPYLRSMADVDVMTHVGHPAGAINIAGQQNELGIEVPTLGIDPPPRSVYEALGGATENMITRHLTDIQGEPFRNFANQVADQEEIPAYTFEPIGYVTGKMFVEAVRNSGKDPEGIADYVRSSTFDTLFSNPIQYTEWGELDNVRLLYSEFASGAPSYYPDGEFHLEPIFETSDLPAYDPEELPLG